MVHKTIRILTRDDSLDDAIVTVDGYGILYESDTVYSEDEVGFDVDCGPHDTAQLNPSRYPSIQEASTRSQAVIKVIVDNGMLRDTAAGAASAFVSLTGIEGLQRPENIPRFPSVELLKRWVKNDRTDSSLVVTPSQGDTFARPTQVVELIRDALLPENMVWNTSTQGSCGRAYPTLASVSVEFTLNPLQHAAFCKLGKALLTRWLKSDSTEGGYQGADFEAVLSRDQLLFFLGGAGGTGKSRVIDAVTRLCAGWKRESCFLKTALTGKTATLIQGRTLASLLVSLERSKSGDLLDIDMLIIDEISMMTKLDWLKLDTLFGRRKRVSGVPFGGIHIVLVGDFLQLPPVSSDPIYVDPRNKSRYSTADIEGFLLWRRFESVIILEESVRFRDDPEWGEGCAQARMGNWTPAFINLINSRLVRDMADTKWSKHTVFVTPDNVTRTAINNEFVKETSKLLPPGKYPIRLVAQFGGSLSELSRRDVDYVMGLPDSRFGRMAPFIDLIEGMPIQVTQNVRPAKGAANGTLGLLERVVFSPQTQFKLVRDSNANMVVQVPTKPPLYALLRLNRGHNAAPFDESVDSALFPVFPDAQAYSASSISLPKTPSANSRSLSLRLRQLPIVSAVGSTIYKVQGETLQSMVVVEWKSPVAIVNKPQQTYLLVSRVVSRRAFATLTPFTEDLARWSRPPQAALAEELRLRQLSIRTLEEI